VLEPVVHVHDGAPVVGPDQFLAAVRADPGLTVADELVLFLPPAFDLDANLRLLADVAAYVGPGLGWEPGVVDRPGGSRYSVDATRPSATTAAPSRPPSTSRTVPWTNSASAEAR
jgi:hypothetical protein